MRNRLRDGMFVSVLFAAACGTSGSDVTGYKIVNQSGSAMSAVAGDAITLGVVEELSDGSTQALSSEATIAWSVPSTVAALAPGSTADSPLPASGAAPTAVFLTNATRPDISDTISGVLFVLDAGTGGSGSLDVSASMSLQPGKPITGSLTVAAALTGDKTRGQTAYANDCAFCHGQTADGTPANSDGSFTIAGASYSYPAPGLNAAKSSNLGADPGWNAALLAFASRADANRGGVALRTPMPNWLADKDSTTNAPLTTQDFADIYAYLASETQ